MTEELFRYLEMCVNFHHSYDDSFKLSADSCEKENQMYSEALNFLKDLYGSVEVKRPTPSMRVAQTPIGELKNWVIDQLTYWTNYDYRNVCFGASYQTVEANKKILADVLSKVREIEKKEE